MTAEDLIGRLMVIADDPGTPTYCRIRALEAIPRIRRDERRTGDPAARKREELRARRLAKAAKK